MNIISVLNKVAEWRKNILQCLVNMIAGIVAIGIPILVMGIGIKIFYLIIELAKTVNTFGMSILCFIGLCAVPVVMIVILYYLMDCIQKII